MTALFVHAALARGSAWRGVLAHLPGLSAAAPDLPGHGAAPPWDRARPYPEAAAAAVLAAARAAGPWPLALVGHSFGAVIALALALDHPGLARCLVLIEPVLFAAADDPALHAAERAAQAARSADLATRAVEAAAAAFLGRWGGGAPWAALSAAERQAMAARMELVAAAGPALLDDALGLLAPGRLEALGVPVLLVRGAASPPVIAAIHRGLRARLPGAAEAVIAGAGHMAPVTHPEATAAALAAHLAAP